MGQAIERFWQAFPQEDAERAAGLVVATTDLLRAPPFSLKMKQVFLFGEEPANYIRTVSCYNGSHGQATLHLLEYKGALRFLSVVLAFEPQGEPSLVRELWESFLKPSLFLARPPMLPQELHSCPYPLGWEDLISPGIDEDFVRTSLSRNADALPRGGKAHS